MNILIMMNLSLEERNEAEKIIDKTANIKFYQDLDSEKKEEALEKADIIIGGSLSEEQLTKAKNLKMQQIFGTGVNRHHLDLFKERGILLCNSHAHSSIIAEHGFSMLLAASKNLLQADKLLRQGNWDPLRDTSVTLFNKTILFLGFGEIAKHCKKLCKPFNMRYLALKRTQHCDDPEIEVFLEEKKIEALKKADFIFNSLPLTPKTANFVDEEAFENMKSTAIIVNVGRGGTINDKAMFNALKDGNIKGAAIDVWYNYPDGRSGDNQETFSKPCYPSDYPFQDLNNIIMSAHRAWVTDISWTEIRKDLFLNANRFIRGESVKNIINLDEGY